MGFTDAGIMEASVAAIELRRQQQAASAQSNVAAEARGAGCRGAAGIAVCEFLFNHHVPDAPPLQLMFRTGAASECRTLLSVLPANATMRQEGYRMGNTGDVACDMQGNGAAYVDHAEPKDRNGAYVAVDSKQ